MSLTSLIKNLHNAGGNPSLSAEIEKHFIRKANEFDLEKFEDRLTRFHPSQISYWGVCPRAYYLTMKREELGIALNKPKPHETSLLRIFEHGHSIHALYQDKILGPAGVLYGKWELNGVSQEGFQPSPEWKYVEPRLWWTEKRISGYCDGFLKLNNKWYLLEIKSSNDMSFRYLKRSGQPREYHSRQAQIYMQAPHDLSVKPTIQGAFILYVNKDTGEELDLFIENDPSRIEPIMQQIDVAIDSLDNPVVPMRVDDCKSNRSKRAKDCVACSVCFT